MSAHDLGHIPYLLLLLHFLQRWRAEHDGAPPLSYKDKTAFRDMVRNAASLDEENFNEAAAAVLKSLNLPEPPSSALAVLKSPEAQSLTATSSSFWYIANAIHKFYADHKQLPLPGALPDMKAKSADYIQLQNIYKSKAREDCAEVTKTIRHLEKEHERRSELSTPSTEIEAFCKGAAHIKLVRGKASALQQAHAPMVWDVEAAKVVVDSLQGMLGLDNTALIYIAFLAYDNFIGTHDQDAFGSAPRVPGSRDMEVEADSDKVVGTAYMILDKAISQAGTFVENPLYDEAKEELEKIVREM